jgi:glutamate synthase (NADPH/NADH) large chain/glutamate synthase (ferredoxin)
MSGGVAFILNEDGKFEQRCNMGMVELEKVGKEDKAILRELVESHYRYTGSRKAKTVLDAWELMVRKFVKIMPIDYKRVLAERKAAAAKVVAQKEMAAHG